MEAVVGWWNPAPSLTWSKNREITGQAVQTFGGRTFSFYLLSESQLARGALLIYFINSNDWINRLLSLQCSQTGTELFASNKCFRGCTASSVPTPLAVTTFFTYSLFLSIHHGHFCLQLISRCGVATPEINSLSLNSHWSYHQKTLFHQETYLFCTFRAHES